MENKKKVYIVSCAEWMTLATGKNSEGAATEAFEKMIKMKGDKLQISPVIETTCLSDIEDDIELEQYKELVYCPKIMANAGFHDSAKTFSHIIEERNNNE
tara:strand:+ start:415 stop:714 length:300 start_codon:yes stop_codon:yes gene_type:complete